MNVLIILGALLWIVKGIFHPAWSIDLVWVGAGLIALGYGIGWKWNAPRVSSGN